MLTACMPYGFAGGGLPSHVRTIAVLPFDNQTAAPELQREVFDVLRAQLYRKLGLRDATEAKANALVRGSIQRYETDIPIGYSADNPATTSARRMLQISVDVELVDQVSGKTLWQRKGLIAQGQYEERGEAQGRQKAIERMVNDIVQGAQSQW
ncbi:MAG: hypothetical protein H0W69_05020 [Gemmatimonadaceae bacterium]|nr:hypothetical protein [Gemmatimonadaceae bacterium]MBA3656698.1 hypothetical protein [Gemmatimonadaceae bacterium]